MCAFYVLFCVCILLVLMGFFNIMIQEQLLLVAASLKASGHIMSLTSTAQASSKISGTALIIISLAPSHAVRDKMPLYVVKVILSAIITLVVAGYNL